MTDDLQPTQSTICGIDLCKNELVYEDTSAFPNGRCPLHCRVQTEHGLCGNAAMSNGFCHRHGGAATSSLTTSDQYWENSILARERGEKLPGELQKIYAMAVGDPDLLSHRPDLAILETRIHMLLGDIDIASSAKLLKNLTREVNQTSAAMQKAMKKARRSLMSENGDMDKVLFALEDLNELARFEKLQDLLTSGTNQYAAWREVTGLIERARATRASENKRMVQQKKLVETERVLAGMAAVSEQITKIVVRYVDQKTARAMLAEIGQAIREFVGG